MKIIILAGGFGTRLSEETDLKPKPMVEIGGQPILGHLINIFQRQKFNEFVIAVGYKGEVIADWLNSKSWPRSHPSEIIALETGLHTQTGGRIMQCMKANPLERILVTYGDGLANIDINALLKTHESSGKLITVTAVHPPSRFGQLSILPDGTVNEFGEKVTKHEDWINGGFFILEPEVLKYFRSDDDSFEFDILPLLVAESKLGAFKHLGFWKPMDTLREKHEYEELAKLRIPPWLAEIE